MSRRVWRALLPLTVCALLAAFTASQIRLFLRSTGDDAPWLRLFFGQLVWWLLWAGLSVVVWRISRRYPFESGRRIGRAVLHLGTAAVVGMAHTIARVALLPLILGHFDLRWGHEIVFGFSTYFHWNIIIYFLIVASEHAWRYRQRDREREVLLARAELEALRRQLDPHFLFNAMQSVAELIHESPEKAEAMVLRLGELLRWTLKHNDSMEVGLGEELEFTERYLDVERVRFEDRLNVVWDVSPDAHDARVPQLLLQPLVENAIRHGLQPLPEGGTLEITARKWSGSLELSVADDGVGLTGEAERVGLGLENTRARLERFFGHNQQLTLEPRAGGGTVTRVLIPFHQDRIAPS